MIRKAALLLLCSCGGGPGTFVGSVQMNSLQVADAALVGGTEVWLSSAGDLCKMLQNNAYPKNGTLVKIAPRPIGVADFSVTPSTTVDGTASVTFVKLDTTCANTTGTAGEGTAGTVTLTQLDVSKLAAGKFDVTFGNSDHVTGTFNASFCDAPTTYPSPTCQ